MLIFLKKLPQFGSRRYFPTIYQSRSHSETSVESSSKVKFANLRHRKIISVQGKDAASFLQGMVTNDVTLLPEMKSMYAMILNQHGRVMHDIMLYHPEGTEMDEILMECENDSLSTITRMLKLYKLRKKFTVTPREDITIMQAFSDTPSDGKDFEFGDVVACNTDPRVPDFGHRLLIKSLSKSAESVEVDVNDYHRKRYEFGIPEGPSDLPPGNCLPLECNLDYMNGVSFHKGCYIGQELTARTKFTGVIRKRLLPIFPKEGGQVEPGETICNQKGKSAGKIRAMHEDGGVGLALVRLNYSEETLHTKNGKVELACHVPSWWPYKDGTEFSDGVCGPSFDEEN